MSTLLDEGLGLKLIQERNIKVFVNQMRMSRRNVSAMQEVVDNACIFIENNFPTLSPAERLVHFESLSCAFEKEIFNHPLKPSESDTFLSIVTRYSNTFMVTFNGYKSLCSMIDRRINKMNDSQSESCKKAINTVFSMTATGSLGKGFSNLSRLASSIIYLDDKNIEKSIDLISSKLYSISDGIHFVVSEVFGKTEDQNRRDTLKSAIESYFVKNRDLIIELFGSETISVQSNMLYSMIHLDLKEIYDDLALNANEGQLIAYVIRCQTYGPSNDFDIDRMLSCKKLLSKDMMHYLTSLSIHDQRAFDKFYNEGLDKLFIESNSNQSIASTLLEYSEYKRTPECEERVSRIISSILDLSPADVAMEIIREFEKDHAKVMLKSKFYKRHRISSDFEL